MRNRISIRSSIKEAIDNLPAGLCFFAPNGLVVLCNKTMYHLAYEISGRDPQTLSELQAVLKELPPFSMVSKDGDTFLLKDGTAWRFELEKVEDEGVAYTQAIAYEVTALYNGSKELAQAIDLLQQTQAHIRSMKKDIVALTRENEILSMKMGIHDELGASLLKLRRYVLKSDGETKAELLKNWKNTVSMLKYKSSSDDGGDPMADLLRSAQSIGVNIVQKGELPDDTTCARLIVRAIRQCLTNAVKHANGNTIYADIECTTLYAKAVITNDGKAPESDIVEGGGLSSLRKRVEKAGGTMVIQSRPFFSLTITIPLMQAQKGI